MTPTDLIAWRQRLGLNKSEAAASLEITRATYRRYERGEAEIPRTIALACAALSYGLPPMGEKQDAPTGH